MLRLDIQEVFMAVRRVCKYGEAILKKKLKEVDYAAMKDRLPRLIADMFDTMFRGNGAGLAASQIGVDARVVVIQVPDSDRKGKYIKLVMINPVILEEAGVMVEEEGCLSFPGFFATLKRAERVKVKCLNEHGEEIVFMASGFLAKAVQHEIDHLNGICFVDRLPLSVRLKNRDTLDKLKKVWAKIDERKSRRTYKTAINAEE